MCGVGCVETKWKEIMPVLLFIIYLALVDLESPQAQYISCEVGLMGDHIRTDKSSRNVTSQLVMRDGLNS